MNVVFAGGCHLVGKPHGVQYGFVRLLWKTWRKVCPELHFDMVPYSTNWEALRQACIRVLAEPEQQQPDVLVVNLQAGLVLPTWERTLKRLGFGEAQKESSPTENWFAPLILRPKERSWWYWPLKKSAIFLLGGHREDWVKIHEIWAELKGNFLRAKTRVIIMTPTPVESKYFFHGQKNLESVRDMVLQGASEGYYEVCDVYSELADLGAEALWLDGQHLAQKSHVIIANRLGSILIGKEDGLCKR